MAMLQSSTIEERILYWLSLNMEARALAERLLERFAVTVGDLPASAAHHHAESGGLYRHSLEVALKALEEFEGNMVMERRPDGSVDSFRSSRNRPRWQYATFIAALCHDLGKLFELDVRGKRETWCPLDEPYAQFGRRTKTPVASWRPDREHGAHAMLSGFLMHHVLTWQDVAYLGLPRLLHLGSCLSAAHSGDSENPLSRMVSSGDRASVAQAEAVFAAQPDSKVGLLIEAFQELITNGELNVNILSAQVYVEGGKAAVVVPVAISMARERLKARGITLPSNVRIFNMLRNAGLVDADQAGRSVRKIKVPGKQGTVSLSALIFPTEKVVPKQILSTLPSSHFEIVTEPATEATAVAEE